MNGDPKSIKMVEPLGTGWTVADLRRWLAAYSEWKQGPELARAAAAGGSE